MQQFKISKQVMKAAFKLIYLLFRNLRLVLNIFIHQIAAIPWKPSF